VSFGWWKTLSIISGLRWEFFLRGLVVLSLGVGSLSLVPTLFDIVMTLKRYEGGLVHSMNKHLHIGP
jgi:hypothetical protein